MATGLSSWATPLSAALSTESEGTSFELATALEQRLDDLADRAVLHYAYHHVEQVVILRQNLSLIKTFIPEPDKFRPVRSFTTTISKLVMS